MRVRLAILLFALLLLISICSCQSGPFIKAYEGTDVKTVRLGDSIYYLSLPDGFEISEARGKEGQLGYNLKPRDTSSTMYGFIEIKTGQGIRGDRTSGSAPKTHATAYLLNDRVDWTIDQTPTGNLDAYAAGPGELSARASAKSRDELDRMISIIATLRMK